MDYKITVITVVYNDEKNIEKTIKSVLSQSYDNYEYIIIDGKSVDSTVEICNKYKDKISLIISEPDKGIYDAMNKGVSLSSGEWIFFLNSGDVFINENVLEEVDKNIHDCDLLYGYAMTTNGEKTFFPKKITTGLLLSEKMICHQAIFSKKETYLNNNFDLEYKIISDRIWLFNFLIKRKGKQKRIGIPIAIYDTNGVSSNQEKYDNESLRWIKSKSTSFYLFAKLKRIIKKTINTVEH